ncbi:MAG TPA: pilus assembly protein TadG-related protein, partial [Pyrinomonadaceae bacterium]|nr:pilus assembly protein TadG-related protein [Pyrinomonadaceae bacterium]
LLMVGLCLDISRIYLVRAELQNAADAAALTAARELNGGTSGIADAVDQATNIIANTQGLRAKTDVDIASASVLFAVNLNGPYWPQGSDTTANAANIRFVKVTTQATSTVILFASSALGASHAESREAIAGRSVGLTGLCDFYPAAIGLSDPSPTPGTLMTLKFAQGSGTVATINDKDYIVLDVDCIPGNGDTETARLAGGEPCVCNNLGDFLHMTPSSNFANGGSAAGDGMNTRFGAYANGYGNALQPGPYPSDTNIDETITATQYKNGYPTDGNDRRMIIAPIIAPGTYPADTDGRILGWGTFFLKSQMFVVNGNCDTNPPCGYMSVEYVGLANVAATGSVSCTAPLTTPVLYK